MIDHFQREKRDEKEGKVSHHILDDYLTLLPHIHKTRRFKRFFDPARLKMYLIFPSEQTIETNLQVSGGVSHFYKGCMLYRKGNFEEAAISFKNSLLKDNKLYYESKFNLATSLFKLGVFNMAQKFFNELFVEIETERLAGYQFMGKDRRLYFNKAVCELQLGEYNEAIKTINAYTRPIKAVINS